MDFLIVAACIFAMLKYLAHFKKTTNDQLDQKEPKKDDTVVLLEEIRDLLKKIDKVK
ncbi:MscL family protein [Holdemanella biformis]|uniref:MscL family protein n=1 Tax=Holdemanella biformis TaxID=1735 RepID=UPI00286F6CC8|nr:MscL family protein [Holdemanella biformis]MEE0667932.1 MscL family protein [Holdemanella biformis]